MMDCEHELMGYGHGRRGKPMMAAAVSLLAIMGLGRDGAIGAIGMDFPGSRSSRTNTPDPPLSSAKPNGSPQDKKRLPPNKNRSKRNRRKGRSK